MALNKDVNIDDFLMKLNVEVRKIKGRTLGGIVAALQHARRDSQKECPVVTGNLKNSAYIVASDGHVEFGQTPRFKGDEAKDASSRHTAIVSKTTAEARRHKIAGAIGYSALYAPIVHENPRAGKTGGRSPSGRRYTAGLTDAGRKSKRIVFSEVGKYKFLEDPLKANAKEMLKIIANKAKIKK